MKFSYHFKLLFVVCFIVSGCSSAASYYHVKAMPDNAQSIKYENNYQVVISGKEKTTVALFPMNDLLNNNDVNNFYIIINNKGYGIVNFSSDNIRAKCNSGNIRIFSYDESVNIFNKKNEPDLRGLGPSELNTIMAAYLASASKIKKPEQPNFLKRQSISQGQEYGGIIQIYCDNCEGNIVFDITAQDENHNFNFSLF